MGILFMLIRLRTNRPVESCCFDSMSCILTIRKACSCVPENRYVAPPEITRNVAGRGEMWQEGWRYHTEKSKENRTKGGEKQNRQMDRQQDLRKNIFTKKDKYIYELFLLSKKHTDIFKTHSQPVGYHRLSVGTKWLSCASTPPHIHSSNPATV